MSATLKLLVLLICINTFMYLGTNYAMGEGAHSPTSSWITNDLFDILLENGNENIGTSLDAYNKNQNNISYGFAPNANISSAPSPLVGADVSSDTGGFSFYDSLKMVYAFAVTMFKIAFIPIVLFTIQGIPPTVALIIGLPLMAAWIFCIISFIRGGGAP